MFLASLPYELVSYVIQELDLADIYSLSLSCKKFQFLLREPSITKMLLETKAPHSAEAREASGSQKYAVQLRRLIKRREAVASVSPCLVAVVAQTEDWLYESGVLCHIRHRQLRLLDLHHSSALELVVDLKTLLHEASKDGVTPRTGKVQLLHYSHNIVSCLIYRKNRRNPVLLVFDHVKGKIIISRPLESTNKLFVRNNHDFLYYGFTTGPHGDDDEQWVLRAFKVKTGRYLGVFSIPEVIGTDLGSTVCFEIFEGHFYGLSNQASLEVEMGDWVSCYLCFRFPLSEHGFHHIEVLPREQLWRRNQTEGPLDDRWGFMRMFKDEATGQLKVVESRREWLAGAISAKLTYYTTPISFGTHPDKNLPGRCNLEGVDAYIAAVKTQAQRVVPPATARDPHAVHPGDDHSDLAITLSKCHVRSYHPSCQAFVDLVDDSQSFDPRDQRLRLRGGARRLRSADGIVHVQQTRTSVAQGLLPEHTDEKSLLCQIDNLYKSEAGIFWPREPHPQDSSAAAAQNDPALAELYSVLNPPGQVGRPQGSSWDERSMLYATGPSAEGLNALVFVSWDPAIYLSGTPRYPGVLSAAGPENSNGRDMVTPERCPTLQPDATSSSGGNLGPPLHRSGVEEERPAAWKSWEPAQYREIHRGYHFMR